jgi:hypothetical protein
MAGPWPSRELSRRRPRKRNVAEPKCETCDRGRLSPSPSSDRRSWPWRTHRAETIVYHPASFRLIAFYTAYTSHHSHQQYREPHEPVDQHEHTLIRDQPSDDLAFFSPTSMFPYLDLKLRQCLLRLLGMAIRVSRGVPVHSCKGAHRCWTRWS